MRGGPPAWGLGKVLTTPLRKKMLLRNTLGRDASSGDKTCRVSLKNKIEKLVHLVGFVIRKIIFN
jgi:hypothetical protein